MSETAAEPKRLSRRLKFIYGLGDWGTSAATTVRNTFWFIFLTNVVGLDPALAGTTFLIGKLWDGINDPLIGMVSDRIQTRWGRRRPFLLFGSVPFGLSFLLLFYVPPYTDQVALAAYYSLAFLLFDTLYTVVNVPYAALTPELSDDYDERSNITGWRMGVSIFAALITGAAFTLLAEDVIGGRLGGEPADIRMGYLIVAAIWSVTLIIPYLILFKSIEEPEREPDTDPIRPFQTFKEVFQNRPFRLGALIYLLSFATVDVILIVFVRFLIDYVRVAPGYDNLMLATVMGIAFLSMPAVVWLMRRYGKRNTYIGSMLMMAVVLIIMAQVPPGGQNQIFIASIFAGLGYGAATVVPWAIVADVVEEDELKTGKRREGIYSGFLVLLRKLASAVAVFIVGQVLSASGYISSTSGGFYIEQPESALAAMRFFVSTFPAVMLVAAILVAWRYPLDRDSYNEIKRQLAERRAAESRIQAAKSIDADKLTG
jgi:glycoside/pentoside/hexuronide:cation symporter, GPH family